MEEYQKRIIEEKKELEDRLVKLKAFLGSEVFAGLSSAEQQRLARQAEVMGEYLSILSARVADFAPYEETVSGS